MEHATGEIATFARPFILADIASIALRDAWLR
jgi:hypothetical protein